MTDSEEIKRRRTFAIISHPDAGKTTLTEKLLLYGGAIHLAGSVKARKTSRYAVSDWMEIENSVAFPSPAPFSNSITTAAASTFSIPLGMQTFRKILTVRSWRWTAPSWSSTWRKAWKPKRKTFQGLFRPGYSHFYLCQ